MARKAGRSHVRRKGSVVVALTVTEDDFSFATRFAEREGYLDAVDFLQAILTPALWRYRDDFEELPATEAAGARTDLDDDIPF